jgi:hypothetical protein
MKTQLNPRNEASILLATIVVMGIISLALGSYLSLVATQNRTVVSAYTWNTALPYAEAGVEEALTHLVRSSGSNLATRGWTASGADLIKTTTIADGSYAARITGATTNFTIQVTGTAPRINANGSISRTVRVTTQRRVRAPGVVALNGYTVSGNVLMDSFDSSSPLRSTNGLYSPALADDNAFLATNGTNSATVNGSVEIKGKVATGPGGTINTIGAIRIGDDSWNQNGVQAGAMADDFNYVPDDVLVPYATGLGVSGGTVNGTNYSAVLSVSDGDYFHSGNLSGTVYVSQSATLYVTGSFASPLLRIAPGAKLTIFVGGPNFSVVNAGGGGLINESGKAENLTVNGLPGLTSVTISGNSRFTGTIYAPNATMNASGTAEMIGALLVKQLTWSGNFAYHYDEALNRTLYSDFVIASWDEL